MSREEEKPLPTSFSAAYRQRKGNWSSSHQSGIRIETERKKGLEDRTEALSLPKCWNNERTRPADAEYCT